MSEPIEGWVFTVGEDGHWTAQSPSDPDLTVHIDADRLNVYDALDYYPSGSYSVPLAVIDRLRALEDGSVGAVQTLESGKNAAGFTTAARFDEEKPPTPRTCGYERDPVETEE